jgi:hypothetical protein
VARIKGSKNGIRSKAVSTSIHNYKYDVGDSVIYLGGLYKQYQYKNCVIVDRTTRRISHYYDVMFEDGHKMIGLREDWIKRIELEECVDENNQSIV